MEIGPFIVDLPIINGDFPGRKLLVYQIYIYIVYCIFVDIDMLLED